MWTLCQDFLVVSGSVSLFKQKLEAVFKMEMCNHPSNMQLWETLLSCTSKAFGEWTQWRLIKVGQQQHVIALTDEISNKLSVCSTNSPCP